MQIEVSESSQAGEARRRAVEYAEKLEFDEARRGAVAIATTEMASNLVKHAGKGSILLQPIHDSGLPMLRVMAIDRGPGIADVSRAMVDGHSTAGSMGTGLGAIRRLSDSFEIYSGLDVGTIIRADFWPLSARPGKDPARIEIGAVSEP